ncbi:MAG: esterase family protein [Brevibacterium sp.]|uniref:alpha/beta hydrolase n=1 Tax=Brevibacterium sp. TaxID=1701 RepID=UPI0026499E3F|nr:alpha/beta hydrolase family protein [Brevibacterium sp.]MDN5805966.1 esterase family protein [Brevibacterium sp.]MDN5833298.1 esterase family protein [Brevibacterium sp.]MDN5876226.1 esterase family protein [Brevibacterium sp.]MDN5908154.1 esterase family protein [Brevibacterium sp.]MDN6135490.1 esterase family protein [Brevibacterium sp.]
MRRSILFAVGARAIRSLTVARSHRGRFPALDQNSSFLGPEPRGKDARKWHIRDKRKLSNRLREFFVYSPALGRTVGVRVLLPGFPQEVSPVIHLYHGGGDDFRSWTDFGSAEELTLDSPYLVVMPDAGAGTYSRVAVGSEVRDWPTFHTKEVPEFLHKNFSVDFAPENQLLAGLSMGGYGAMKYAAWHPDRYSWAAAFSSPLDPLSAVPAFDVIAMREGAKSMTLFGDPATDRSEWIANSPYGLAENLRGVNLWLSAGSGSLDESKDRDLLETMVNQQGERFSARLNALDIRHSWFPRTTGLHNWTSWERELGAWLKTLRRDRDYASSDHHSLERRGGGLDSRRGDSVDPRRGGPRVADGGEFSYLTGHALFAIHGWRVEISRRRAQIVRFGSVSAAGFSLTGTGSFRVRTPGLYEPGRRYDISVVGPTGTNDYPQRADKKGRLTLTGRLAAAMHDPIIPGKRTQHFTTAGQSEVMRVHIASAPDDSSARDGSFVQARATQTDEEAEETTDVSDSAHVDADSHTDTVYGDNGRDIAAAFPPSD